MNTQIELSDLEARTKQFYAEHQYLVIDHIPGVEAGHILPRDYFPLTWGTFMRETLWMIVGPATTEDYDQLTQFVIGRTGLRRSGGTLYRVVAAD